MSASGPAVGARLTEGELWTREQLALLIDAGFRPRAVGGFLAASQRRANRIRNERPHTAAGARAATAAGAAGWVALALAGVQPYRRRVRAGLLWWALTGAMLDWHLGMVETEDGRPRPLGAADAVTLVRVWLVPVAADSPTIAVCTLAAASDWLDGTLARRAEPTRIGRDLEGLADACFAVAALRGARARGWLGTWPAAGELARLLAGTGYALWAYFARAGAPDPEVTRAARVTTPVRTAGLVAAAAGLRRPATALVIGGSAVSVAAVARALQRARAAGP